MKLGFRDIRFAVSFGMKKVETDRLTGYCDIEFLNSDNQHDLDSLKSEIIFSSKMSRGTLIFTKTTTFLWFQMRTVRILCNLF